MDADTAWRLYVLGAFRLVCAGQPVHLPTRKTASLLAFLALHPGPHSREELAALLWGDVPDSDARPSLRTSLSSLRVVLGEDAILADRDAARLNPAFPLWVDAVAFETDARLLLRATGDVDMPSTIALYSGDLLPDFDHEWIVPERERLRALLLEALLSMAQELRSRSEYAQAIACAERVLQLEPSNERAHQHLMFCRMSRLLRLRNVFG